MQSNKHIENFNFVKGQTIYVLEIEFFISVRKMFILEILTNHPYDWRDPWGEFDNENRVGKALRVLEGGKERIVQIENFELNTFVFTKSRKAMKLAKSFTKDIEGYDMVLNSSFTGHWSD